jgi:hypothetical protein
MAIAFTTRGANFINAGSGSSIDNLTALTYTAWIYPTSVAANDYSIMGIGTFAAQTRKDFGFDTSASSIFFVVDCSTTDAGAASTFSPSANTWYFVAVTWAGIGNVPRLYTATYGSNAAEVGSYSEQLAGAGSVNNSAASNFYVGNIGLADRSIIGRIAHPRIWNRALSIGELIHAQYLPTAVPSGQVLRYDPTSASTAVDLSWTGNTGTITNGTLADNPLLSGPGAAFQRKILRPRPFAPGIAR